MWVVGTVGNDLIGGWEAPGDVRFRCVGDGNPTIKGVEHLLQDWLEQEHPHLSLVVGVKRAYPWAWSRVQHVEASERCEWLVGVKDVELLVVQIFLDLPVMPDHQRKLGHRTRCVELKRPTEGEEWDTVDRATINIGWR